MEQPVRSPRAVSVRRMQQIDEAAVHTVGIPRLLLMERAGQAVARAVQQILAGSREGGASGRLPARGAGTILVCCGVGYNGGDGLCAAWHLAQRGETLRVILAGSRQRLKEEPRVYAGILEALGISPVEVTAPTELDAVQPWCRDAEVIIDALLGIGVQGTVRPLYAGLIRLINAAGKPVVSADVPSGLDADTGCVQGLAVEATVTVTFGLPKQGFFQGDGPAHVGKMVVDDLGIPASLLSP